MDSNLDKALKKKRELERQLRDVEQYIDLHERLFGEKLEQIEFSESRVQPDAVESAPNRRRSKQNPVVVADTAERILQDAGRPMVRGEIVKELRARGIRIPAKNVAKYVGTILWRNQDRFVNIEDHGYWLKSRPYPPAHYDPDMEDVIGVTDNREPSLLD